MQCSIQEEQARLAKRVAGQRVLKRAVHRDFAGKRRRPSDAESGERVVNLVYRKIKIAVRRKRIRNQGSVRESAGQSRAGPFRNDVGRTQVFKAEGLPGLIAQEATEFPILKKKTPETPSNST